MSAPDLYYNRLGDVMVVAPSDDGSLRLVSDKRQVELERGSGEISTALARWIFADFARDTLKDQWGNSYDHMVHSLIMGTLSDGEAFLQAFIDAGYGVEHAPKLFVPIQTVNIHSYADSDDLRNRHPRAFALAIRTRPSAGRLMSEARDRAALGRHPTTCSTPGSRRRRAVKPTCPKP